MKILVENSGYHLRNLGDAAMLQAACLEILSSLPGAEIKVFTHEPERLRQICPQVDAIRPTGQAAWLAAKCYPVPQSILPKRVRAYVYAKEKDFKFKDPLRALSSMEGRSNYRQYYAAEIMSWLDAIDWADAVVATGGGYVTDGFGGHFEGILHTLRWARQKQRPTAFFGQGLGPLTIKRLRRMVGMELESAQCVSLREGTDGFKLGKQLHCDTSAWKVTGDDAFAWLAGDGLCESKGGNALGINLRVANYAGVDQRNADALSASLEKLRASLGADWMPLPVDLCPKTGDAVQTISQLTEGTISTHFHAPNVPMDLAALVAHCRMVVTGSYHAAVFALAQGIPVVALAANAYYDSKFNGLAAFFTDGIRIVNHTHQDFERTFPEAVSIQWNLPQEKRHALVAQSRNIATSVKAAYRGFFEKLDA